MKRSELNSKLLSLSLASSLLLLGGCDEDEAPKKPEKDLNTLAQQMNRYVNVMPKEVPAPPPPPPEPEPEKVELADVLEPVQETAKRMEEEAVRERKASFVHYVTRLQRERFRRPGRRSQEKSVHFRMSDPDFRQRARDKGAIGADTSTFPVPLDRVITADTHIPCLIEAPINSKLSGGRVIAIVMQDILSKDGRQTILLPKGTKIFGTYESLKAQGDDRLEVECFRALTPDNINITLDGAYLADQMGHKGLVGTVDNRVWDRYGEALIVSAVGAAALSQKSPQGTMGVPGPIDHMAKTMALATTKTLENHIDLRPVITIPGGTLVTLILKNDLWLRAPERIEDDAEDEAIETAPSSSTAQDSPSSFHTTSTQE